jgi:hypothetical protein
VVAEIGPRPTSPQTVIAGPRIKSEDVPVTHRRTSSSRAKCAEMLIHLNRLGEVGTRITIGRRNKSGDDRGGGGGGVWLGDADFI